MTKEALRRIRLRVRPMCQPGAGLVTSRRTSTRGTETKSNELVARCRLATRRQGQALSSGLARLASLRTSPMGQPGAGLVDVRGQSTLEGEHQNHLTRHRRRMRRQGTVWCRGTGNSYPVTGGDHSAAGPNSQPAARAIHRGQRSNQEQQPQALRAQTATPV